jgi:hypothetical protein
MNNLTTAFDFVNAGIGVIPVRYMDKKPMIDWKIYQTTLPTEKEIIAWFSQKTNLGIVTGWKGLTVLDFDDSNEYTKWLFYTEKRGGMTAWIGNHAYRVQTARGMHVYIRLPEAIKTKKVGKIDIKGKAGYVLGEGSVHPSGIIYRAIREQKIIPLVETLSDVLPLELLTQSELPTGINAPVIAHTEQTDPWEAASKPAMKVSNSLIEQIKQTYSIESFFTNLVDTGKTYKMGACPFHDDQHASFWIDTEKQIGNCFTCGFTKVLDVINFTARLYGMTNREAIMHLARR